MAITTVTKTLFHSIEGRTCKGFGRWEI